MNVSEFE